MSIDMSEEALRLRDTLHRNEDNFLGLNLAHERLEIELMKPCSVTIKTDLHHAPDIPLLDINPWDWIGGIDRAEIRTQSNHAFAYLAFTRAWRRAGTLAPPAGLLATDMFTVSLLDEICIDHQQFVDLAWRKSKFESFGMQSTPWRDSRARPKGIRALSEHEPETIAFPEDLPWLGGYCLPMALLVNSVGFDNGVTITPAPGVECCAILTVPRRNDAPVLDAKGGDLGILLSSPLLSQFGLEILKRTVQKSAVRYYVDWFDAGSDAYFDDDVDSLRLLREELITMDTTSDGANSNLVDLYLSLGFRE